MGKKETKFKAPGHLGLLAFGDAQQRLGFIIHMKRNWISKLSVVTLLDIQLNPKGIGFIVLIIIQNLLKRVMPDSLRMVKSVRVINYKKIIQEVKVQVSLPITSKEIVVPTIVESHNNVEQQINDQSLPNEITTNEQIMEEP